MIYQRIAREYAPLPEPARKKRYTLDTYTPVLGAALRKRAIKELHKEAAKHTDPNDGRIPTCLPAEMTRIPPFSILSRKDMKQIIIEKGLIYQHSWGRMTLEGEQLTIFDEDTLLVLLALMLKNGNLCFQTSLHEICKLKKTVVRKDTAKAIWRSLRKIAKTLVDIEDNEIIKGKKHKIRGFFNLINKAMMRESVGKIYIELNDYFLEMMAPKLMTYMDLTERLELKGDITKALHRFLEGQSGFQISGSYQLGLFKLCGGLNMEDKDPKIMRWQIKNAIRKLIDTEYLKEASRINKNDTVLFWRVLRRKPIQRFSGYIPVQEPCT